MNRTADVVVVGAGVIGAGVAYELSRRGVRVRLVDQRGAAQGATQASAGMLAPHTETHDQPDLWRLAAASLDLYDEFLARVTEDSGSAVEYGRCGSLHIALDDAQTEELRRTAARLGEKAVESELLTGAAVRELEPELAEDAIGALLVPSHGYVAAGDFTRAMVAAGTVRGVRFDRERVLSIRAQPSGVVLETTGDEVHARAAVVASGSWTSRVFVEGDIELPVRPVRGQLVQLDWPTPPLGRIVWGPDCYLVPWETGGLLVGATVEEAGFDERATAAGVRDLLDAACDLLPQAWQAAFAGVRVGLRPATPDGMPAIGASPRVGGVYYATGHFRNGVLLAPATAVLLSDLVLTDRCDQLLAPFSPARFA